MGGKDVLGGWSRSQYVAWTGHSRNAAGCCFQSINCVAFRSFELSSQGIKTFFHTFRSAPLSNGFFNVGWIDL